MILVLLLSFGTTAFAAEENINQFVEPTASNLETLEVKATAYCPCKKCCGKTDKITYSGIIAQSNRTIAVDPSIIPIGSKVYVEGLGVRYAEDIGGAIKEKRIDIYMDNHEAALTFGIQNLEIYVLEQ